MIDSPKKMDQIITSLLDTDLYKFSMGQTIFHQFNSDETTWTFKCRNEGVRFTSEMVEEITEQIKRFCSLRFTEDELNYLLSIKWLKRDYIDFLRYWHPRFEEFQIGTDSDCGLTIETHGTWLSTSMYEVPVLAIVNEVYFTYGYNIEELEKQQLINTDKKIAGVQANPNSPFRRGAKLSEFGTRRRLSKRSQREVIRKFAESGIEGFVGTSNVYYAKEFNLMPVGTMAHEYIMTVGQGHHEYNPAYSNKFALDAWVKEYGILNGIALTDTITTECFLRDFRMTYATLFSGVRHDSGEPIAWATTMLHQYSQLGIDARTKTLLFSDSLNFKKCWHIFYALVGRCKVAFGIGTWLTNDCGVEPLNIVMKVTEANGQPVAKLSDAGGKCMCKDEGYVDYLKRAVEWRLEHE